MLTKRQALEICRDLWTWLAQSGSRFKLDWGGWAVVGKMDNDCPCCEYIRQHPPHRCSICPMASLWPNSCMSSHDSPYTHWEHTVGRTRRKWAKVIADHAAKLLSDLPEEEP